MKVETLLYNATLNHIKLKKPFLKQDSKTSDIEIRDWLKTLNNNQLDSKRQVLLHKREKLKFKRMNNKIKRKVKVMNELENKEILILPAISD